MAVIKNRDSALWYNRMFGIKQDGKKMYMDDTGISDQLIAVIINYMEEMETDYIPMKMMEKQLENMDESDMKEELREIRWDYKIKGISYRK
jgi:predicted nuclease of restriction endonuclease-like (RecB) superfamily